MNMKHHARIDPEELANILENSLVGRCKLLLSLKNFEEGPDGWLWKARFVAAGHLYFDKWMKCQRRNEQHDGNWWAPVASLEGSRLWGALLRESSWKPIFRLARFFR